MERDEVLNYFRESGALLEGHFVLTSGLHSPMYLQCARVMMDPVRASKLCEALAGAVRNGIGDNTIEFVVSPAMGGVIVGYEMARQLGTEAMFTERMGDKFTFRRGFTLPPGARVLMAEDIVTTGLSSRECIACIEGHGGEVVAASCLVDRSNGAVDLGVPLFALTRIEIPNYPENALPPELAAIPVTKPGSRNLT